MPVPTNTRDLVDNWDDPEPAVDLAAHAELGEPSVGVLWLRRNRAHDVGVLSWLLCVLSMLFFQLRQ